MVCEQLGDPHLKTLQSAIFVWIPTKDGMAWSQVSTISVLYTHHCMWAWLCRRSAKTEAAVEGNGSTHEACAHIQMYYAQELR